MTVEQEEDYLEKVSKQNNAIYFGGRSIREAYWHIVFYGRGKTKKCAYW